jgi:hypothetical protein
MTACIAGRSSTFDMRCLCVAAASRECSVDIVERSRPTPSAAVAGGVMAVHHLVQGLILGGVAVGVAIVFGSQLVEYIASIAHHRDIASQAANGGTVAASGAVLVALVPTVVSSFVTYGSERPSSRARQRWLRWLQRRTPD